VYTNVAKDEEHIFRPQTKAWLDETTQQIFTAVDKQDDIVAYEFIQQIPERRILIPKWFRMLIRQARDYTAIRGNTLDFTPLPDTAKEWRDAHPDQAFDPVSNQVQRENEDRLQTAIEDAMLNEFDTHGLDQAFAHSEYGAAAEMEDEDSGDDDFAYAYQGGYRPVHASE